MQNNNANSAISDEAIEWFSKLSEGHATAEDYRQFDLWLKQSPLHAKAYEEIEHLWGTLGVPANTVFARQKKQNRLHRFRAKTNHLLKPDMRFVGGLALVLLLLAVSRLPEALHYWNADYSTEWGEQRELVLADGSHLLLNTHSAVSIDFTAKQRAISLLAGEVYFQVAHNSDRPFVVTTDFGQIKVTGTEFNVYAQKQQITVTVAEGRVLVYKNASENDAVVLTAGLQTIGDRHGIDPSVTADTERALAWRHGFLMFTLQPLSDVVDELNRYIPGRIVIADPGIRRRIVSGTFDLTRPSDISPIIEKTLNINSVNIADTLTLLY